MKIDMTDRQSGGYNMTIGTCLARVKTVQESQSKAGDPQIILGLVRDDGRDRICDLRLTFSPKGASIAKDRLVAFGVAEDFQGELDLSIFNQARVWVSVCLQKDNPKYLDIDISELENAGLQHVDNPPPGFSRPEPDADTPF